MKSILSILFITTIFIGTLNAQPRQTIEFQGSGGLAYPQSPKEFKNYWEWGFNGGLGLIYNMSPQLGFTLQVDYHNFSFDLFQFRNERLDPGEDFEGLNIQGESATIISTNLNVGYTPFLSSSYPSPYIFGGAGYMYLPARQIIYQNPELGIDDLFQWEQESTLILNVGVGVNIPSEKYPAFFFETRYVVGFTSDDPMHYFLLRFGIRYGISL